MVSVSGELAWNVLYEVLAAHEPDLQLPRHRRRSREARQRPAQSTKANKTPYFSSIQIRHTRLLLEAKL